MICITHGNLERENVIRLDPIARGFDAYLTYASWRWLENLDTIAVNPLQSL